jgi:glyoxylase-like metal-dependent hydrolase (beta-lactamase superfamily II)
MEEIIVLNIKYIFGNTEEMIHPVILLNDSEMVLVDCGYRGFLPNIEEAMRAKNLDFSKLNKILITHHDYDHMGALAAFKLKYPAIEVVASHIEAPYITGEKKALRLEQAESIQKTLPDEQKAFGQAFCDILKSVEPAKVDRLVQDGDAFNWCGSCKIIGTPGHTPGHISLYLEDKRTIITGDATVVENNQLVIANPQFTLDMEKAKESLSKLLNFDVNTFICYHGGVYERNVRKI